MARGFPLLSIILLLAGIPGFGQVIPGIGYPGGGYPGGGYPGRRYPQGSPGSKAPDSKPKQAATTLIGMLRSIGDNNLVVEAEDKTITTVSTSKSTKYFGVSGASAKIGDFQPGDHVRVAVNQDKNNVYHGSTMTMVREGTLEEHAAASQATHDTSHPLTIDSAGSSASLPAGTSSGSDNSNPRSRPPTSTAETASSGSSTSPSSSSASNTDDPDRPRLHRASGSSSGTPNGQSTPADSATAPPSLSRPASSAAPRDADDSEPPRLRRGVSAGPDTSSTGSDAVAADARPNLHASDDNGVTRPPSPPRLGAPSEQRLPASGDPFIDQTREEAFSFTETLPNYVVKQYTTRYVTDAARRSNTSWQAQDNVTADVIEENGTEKYRNILVNGQPPKVDIEKTGSWSRGEFSSLQVDVLSPYTNANFHGKQATTIVNRAAFRYDFSVEQPNSHWHVESQGQSYQPAYSGSIWIDKENYRVLRIELSAQNMPRTFPLDTVESAVDYDYVFIGEGKYLLPVHSEALSCVRGTSECSRNVIEFRNYKKFTADSNITFDPHN